jgi:hypothetical protein
MNIFLCIFYLLQFIQEQKLNHKQYCEQEVNMGNFVQATEPDVHMFAKFGGLAFYGVL